MYLQEYVPARDSQSLVLQSYSAQHLGGPSSSSVHVHQGTRKSISFLFFVNSFNGFLSGKVEIANGSLLYRAECCSALY